MDKFFSVWLVPQKDDEVYLGNIIKNLGEEYDAPIFVPHLTLLGDVTVDFDKLKSIVDDVFQNTKPFTIEKERVNQSEAFFKTVFIEFEKDQKLSELFETISQKTDGRELSTFKPHISLIYKEMPKNERRKIAEQIEQLDVKNEFIINKIVIVAPKKGEEGWYNVEGWRELYVKALND